MIEKIEKEAIHKETCERYTASMPPRHLDCPACRLERAAPALLLQLKQAHGIIRRLAKLARYYGYADEIPRLRETPRKAAIALAEKGAWL